MKKFILMLVVLALGANLQAAVINVPGDVATIQGAINGAVNGDTILVAPDTYTENINFGDKDVALVSSGGPDVTFLHANDAGLPIITIDDGSILNGTVYGFTFEDASKVALDVSNAVVLIRNNVFRNITTTTHEGAIRFQSSFYSRVDSNTFYNITANQGAAIRLLDCKQDTIAYNLIYNVGNSRNIHAFGCNGIFFHNNTLVGGIGNGIGCLSSSQMKIYGNIVTGFTDGTGIALSSVLAYSIDYNCTFNNGSNYSDDIYIGANDITDDPLFENSVFGNYNLISLSPCIDAGDPDPFFNDPDDSRNDIGAIYKNPVFPGLYNINYGSAASGQTVYLLPPTFYWTYFDEVPSVQSGYEVQVGTDTDWTTAEMWSSGTVSSADTLAVYGGLSLTRGERYYVRIRVSNGTDWSEWVGAFFDVSSSVIVRVPGAVSTIQGGIDMTSDSDTVLVAEGTYSGDGNRDLDFGGRHITLLSENGAANTIIDCEGTELEPHRGFSFTNNEDGTAVVHGFKIINGYGALESGVSRGGAVYCDNSSPLFNECTFEQNFAEEGSAVYCPNSNAVFTSCVFRQNTSDSGGTVYYSNSNTTLNQCGFYENISGMGGGILGLNSELAFTGCTFNLNSADSGGAIFTDNTVLDLNDCVFNENSATNGGAVFCKGMNSTLLECDFSLNTGNYGGALYLASSESSITDASFENNSVVANGGAIYLRESSPNISSSIFNDNSCGFSGGAICGFMAHPNISVTEFFGNQAYDGGALFFDGGLDSGRNKLSADTTQILQCTFGLNRADTLTSGSGGAIFWQWDEIELQIVECDITDNKAFNGGAFYGGGYLNLYMRNCTIVGNRADNGAGLNITPSNLTGNIEYTILAFNNNGEAVYCQPETNLTLNCCDVYGNDGGDYSGCIASQESINDNFSLNPNFCEGSLNLYALTSPCTAEASPCGMLIGAYDDVCSGYRCGDANRDSKVSVSDAVYIINFVFTGGSAPYPYLTGDCNCDGKANVSDAIWIINYVFIGGNIPCDTDGDNQRDC